MWCTALLVLGWDARGAAAAALPRGCAMSKHSPPAALRQRQRRPRRPALTGPRMRADAAAAAGLCATNKGHQKGSETSHSRKGGWSGQAVQGMQGGMERASNPALGAEKTKNQGLCVHGRARVRTRMCVRVRMYMTVLLHRPCRRTVSKVRGCVCVCVCACGYGLHHPCRHTAGDYGLNIPAPLPTLHTPTCTQANQHTRL